MIAALPQDISCAPAFVCLLNTIPFVRDLSVDSEASLRDLREHIYNV